MEKKRLEPVDTTSGERAVKEKMVQGFRGRATKTGSIEGITKGGQMLRDIKYPMRDLPGEIGRRAVKRHKEGIFILVLMLLLLFWPFLAADSP